MPIYGHWPKKQKVEKRIQEYKYLVKQKPFVPETRHITVRSSNFRLLILWHKICPAFWKPLGPGTLEDNAQLLWEIDLSSF